MADPYTMSAIQASGEGLSGFMEYLGGSERRRYEKLMREMGEWKFGAGKDLYAQLQGLLSKGTTISPVRRRRMRGRYRQGLQPVLRQIMSRTGASTDLRSPEATRLVSRQYAPMEANFMAQLDQLDLRQLQELRRMLLSATFGG